MLERALEQHVGREQRVAELVREQAQVLALLGTLARSHGRDCRPGRVPGEGLEPSRPLGQPSLNRPRLASSATPAGRLYLRFMRSAHNQWKRNPAAVTVFSRGKRARLCMEASTLTPASSRAGLLGRRSPLLKLQGDERLVALIRDGHDHAFDVLFDRYHSRLLAFCRHMLRSTEDAEDVLQEVFVKAHAAMLADERAINVRPWLYRIARNRCLNHLRRPVPEGQDSMDVMVGEGGVTTADRVQKREDFRALVADVQDLPETQRTALLLREIDALSYEEIAETMDTTVPAVKSLLVRARMSLAEATQSRQLTCGEVQLELAEAAEGLRKASGPVRHHVKRCEPCREFRGELRSNTKALAALAPIGPLALLCKTLIAKLGWVGGSGTAAGGSAGAAGRRRGRRRAGAAGAGGGAAGAGGGAGAGGAAARRRRRRGVRRRRGGRRDRRRDRRQGRGDRGDRRAADRRRGRGPPDLLRHAARRSTPGRGRRRGPGRARSRRGPHRRRRHIEPATATATLDEPSPAPTPPRPPRTTLRRRPSRRPSRPTPRLRRSPTSSRTAPSARPAGRRRRRRRRQRQRRRRRGRRSPSHGGPPSRRRRAPAGPPPATEGPRRGRAGAGDAAGTRGAGRAARRRASPSPRRRPSRRPLSRPAAGRGRRVPRDELSSSNVAAGGRTRSFTEARPMWPSASASSRRPGSIPQPSSATSSSSASPSAPRCDRDPVGPGVAGGVGEQLAGDREHSSSSRSSALGSISSSTSKPPWRAAWRATAPSACSKPALLERHRVQRHHRLAQARDRRLDDLVRALDLGAPRRGLDQLLVGGEQGLQRVVVDQLRDPPPALVLGLHHLGDELAAGLELLAQLRRARRAGASFSAREVLGARRPAHLLEQAAPHRLGDGGGAVGDAELLVERVQVALDRGRREVDLLADLGGREALGDQRRAPPARGRSASAARRCARAPGSARRAPPAPRRRARCRRGRSVTIASQTSWREDSFER